MHHHVDPGSNVHFSPDKIFPKRMIKRFFHYTDAASALGMLERHKEAKDKDTPLWMVPWKDTHQELWATHFSYLNDKTELDDGLSFFLEVLNNDKLLDDTQKVTIRDKIKDFGQDQTRIRRLPYYPICFCKNGDLLSQWKYYGKECGIAIEYDLPNCFFDSGYEMHNSVPDQPQLRDILYFEKDKMHNKTIYYGKRTAFEGLIKQITIEKQETPDDNALFDDLVHAVFLLSLIMKHSSFAEEAECRLLFRIADTLSPVNNASVLYFRKRDNLVIPYIKARFRGKNDNTIPIKSITIGPGQQQELIFETFLQFILTNFYGKDDTGKAYKRDGCEGMSIRGVKLLRSSIPFRG